MVKSEDTEYKSLKFMGASGWDYFVPYEADISAALQRLRDDVFARGDYATAEDMVASMDWEATAKRYIEWANHPGQTPEIKRSHLESAEHAMKRHREQFAKQILQPKAPKPKTIEELLEQEGAEGTHSILDIECISTKPKFGAISPFPRSKLKEFFDSETPDHFEIQEAYEFGSLEKYVCKRWQGIYIIAYRDGSPHEIFFAGCSGD